VTEIKSKLIIIYLFAMFKTFAFQAKSFCEFEFIQKIIYFLTMRFVNKIRHIICYFTELKGINMPLTRCTSSKHREKISIQGGSDGFCLSRYNPDK